MKKIFGSLLLVFVFFACNPKSESVAYDSEKAGVDMAMVDEEISLGQETVVESKAAEDLSKALEKKIIRTGEMTLDVADLNREKKIIDTLVKTFKAYYDNETLSNSDYQSSYNLIIRVPVDRFDALIARLEAGDSEITYKKIDAQDVTEEFIDLEARLANKKKYMERYGALLQKARSVEEIMQIQDKIRSIEEEIESVTGRLKYLGNQVNYSTLQLTLIQQKEYRYTPSQRPGFIEKIRESFLSGWYGFVDFLYFLLSNWVMIIVIGVATSLIIKYRRKRKAAKASKKSDV